MLQTLLMTLMSIDLVGGALALLSLLALAPFAIGATLTILERPYDNAGIRKRTFLQYTGPASYVTGGDSLEGQELKLGSIEMIHFEKAWDGTNYYDLRYDYDSNLVLWLDPTTGAEVANGTDLSGFTARLEAFGT